MTSVEGIFFTLIVNLPSSSLTATALASDVVLRLIDAPIIGSPVFLSVTVPCSV